MKKIFVLLVLSVVLFSYQSCKKKEEAPNIPADELLTRDSWQHYKNTLFNKSGEVIYSLDKNGRMVFTKTNDYFYHDENNDVDTYGKWELLENDTQIKLFNTEFQTETVYKIYKLTEDELIYYREYRTGGKYVYYFKRED